MPRSCCPSVLATPFIVILLTICAATNCSASSTDQHQHNTSPPQTNKQTTLVKHHCETISECLPCSEADFSSPHRYCEATKYYHVVECREEDPTTKEIKKTTTKESCRPDIIYTPNTIQNLILFECFLLSIILITGFLFYRRTKKLSEDQNERYRRLVQPSSSNR